MLDFLQGELIKHTKTIFKSPYEPRIWLHRARTLQRLGFPELAVGDAYKARLLIEAGREKGSIFMTYVSYQSCLYRNKRANISSQEYNSYRN